MANLDNFRLVVFRKVAGLLSFRKAAEALYLTQPAVSLQIKALEEDLGAQLFDRSGSHIHLTPAGSLLLQYADQSSSLLEQASQAIASLGGNHAGHLSLGASTTIAQYVLPHLLGKFQCAYPRVQSTLISGNTEHIVEAVESKKIMLGLIEGPARSRGVKTEPFLQDELVLIVSVAHEWADLPSIKVDDLRHAPLLMRESGSGTRRVVEMALERLGLKRNSLNIVMELDSTEAIKSAVDAGLGIGFISRTAITKDMRLDKDFRILKVDNLKIDRNFLLCSLPGPAAHDLATQFRRFLCSTATTASMLAVKRTSRK